MAVLLVLLLASWPSGSRPAAAAGPDPFCGLPSGTVKPDRHFNSLFIHSKGGWTGADGTYSVALPDGRTVWMFGDTFVGPVNPDRTRPKNSHLISNSFIVQRRDVLRILHGGTALVPRALVVPADGKGFYWPGDGTIAKGRLSVFFNRFERTGTQPWQWRWLETTVFNFALPELVQVSRRTISDAAGVMYGAAVFEEGRHVYVYGTRDLQRIKYTHVARFPAGGIDGRWQYFTGRGWSSDPQRSVPVLAGVANQFSVLKLDGRYLLVTTDNRRPFTATIVAYVSDSPHGRWKPAVKLYDPPEAGDGIVAYNALAHPQFTQDNRLLLSYNLNRPADFEALFRNADAYRPRFVRVPLKALNACLAVEPPQP